MIYRLPRKVVAGENLAIVNAVRWGTDWNALQKQWSVEAEDAGIIKRMKFDNLVNKAPLLRKIDKVSRNTSFSKKNNAKHLASARTLTKDMKHYAVLSNFTQASAEINKE